MNIKLLGMAFAVVGLLASCNKEGWQTDKTTGLKYQIFKEGDGSLIQEGDYLSVNIILKTDKDSIIENTYSSGRTFNYIVEKPRFNYDIIMSGVTLLHKGDSAAFCIPADSIFNANAGGYHPLIEPGSNLILIMKIEDVKDTSSMEEEANKNIEEYIEESKINFSKTESGLFYNVTKAGKGNVIKLGDTITVHYTGMLLDGTVFDSSIPRNEPFKLVLMEGNVIQGWTEGLQMMKKGEAATFIIPPSLAYGEQGAGPIPPYTPLVFNIEVVDVKKGRNTYIN